jgi:hypothetical protein
MFNICACARVVASLEKTNTLPLLFQCEARRGVHYVKGNTPTPREPLKVLDETAAWGSVSDDGSHRRMMLQRRVHVGPNSSSKEIDKQKLLGHNRDTKER